MGFTKGESQVLQRGNNTEIDQPEFEDKDGEDNQAICIVETSKMY